MRRYRGTVALRDVLLGPPDDVTALALTGWDDSFVLHGLQPLPTPIPSGRLPPISGLAAVTDLGTRHESHGAGGHGHPRFLWHITFVPELPPGTRSLTLSDSTEGSASGVVLELPRWPPEVEDAPAQEVTADQAIATHLHPDRAGEALPDRVVALKADLGVVADVRRALTTLYCWPSWFLLTLEATGAIVPQEPPMLLPPPWEIHDDRGNRYLGRWSGGWGGADFGAHVAFGPGLDPQARRLHVAFVDPFTSTGLLTADVSIPPT